jgi:hypothetical protein
MTRHKGDSRLMVWSSNTRSPACALSVAFGRRPNLLMGRGATPGISAIATCVAASVRYATCYRSIAMFITRAPHSVVFVHGATFPRPLFFEEKTCQCHFAGSAALGRARRS